MKFLFNVIINYFNKKTKKVVPTYDWAIIDNEFIVYTKEELEWRYGYGRV